MEKIKIERTVLKVNNQCTLRCKLCLAFIPYYNERYNLTLSDSKIILKNYFNIIDTVDSFTLTGGEPLMNNQLHFIAHQVLKYESQINQRICIVTNGTLNISTKLIDILASSSKTFVVISNYGKKLSKKTDMLASSLKKCGIDYRIEDYHNDIKYGGWLDFRDHSLKHITTKEKHAQSKSCFWRQGEYFDINFGELHPCSRSFWRMYKGVIEKNKDQFINLRDRNLNIESSIKKLCNIRSLKYLDSCAYCDGNKENSKRYIPAEQL